MGLAVLGIIALCFIALVILSAKTWQIWHVLAVAALFFATFSFCALAAATLKTQMRWRTKYEGAAKQLKLEVAEQNRLLRGSPNSTEPTLPGLQGDVRRTLVDRGRVWRNLALSDVGQGTVTLDASNWGDEACQKVGTESGFAEDLEPIPGETDAEGAEDGVKELGLQSNAIVFAFQEMPIATLSQEVRQVLYGDDQLPGEDTTGLCKIPAFFLGEFKIISDPTAEPTVLKLQPTLPLTDAQIEQVEDAESTWVIYEVLPIDSHEAFGEMTAEQMQLLIDPVSDDDSNYATLIDSYVRDQDRASDMDPPERKWMKVRFTGPVTVDVDLQEPTPLPDTPFDPSGRSISDNLRQDEQSKFEQGDEVQLDFATAQEYINQGVAEPIEPIYSRRLRDYERYFRTFAGDLEAISRQIVVAQEDYEKLNQSISDLREQIAFFTRQEQDLTHDRDGFDEEKAVITAFRDALEQKWTELLSELSRLYRANKQLASRLSPRRNGSAIRRNPRVSAQLDSRR